MDDRETAASGFRRPSSTPAAAKARAPRRSSSGASRRDRRDVHAAPLRPCPALAASAGAGEPPIAGTRERNVVITILMRKLYDYKSRHSKQLNRFFRLAQRLFYCASILLTSKFFLLCMYHGNSMIKAVKVIMHVVLLHLTKNLRLYVTTSLRHNEN